MERNKISNVPLYDRILDFLQPLPSFKEYFDSEEEEMHYKRYSNRSQSLNISMKPPEINPTPVSRIQIESNRIAARRQSENVEDVIRNQKEKLLKLESKRTRNTMSLRWYWILSHSHWVYFHKNNISWFYEIFFLFFLSEWMNKT